MPKNRQTDGHMRAVLASVIRQYLPERYSHFIFSSEFTIMTGVGVNSTI